MVNRKTLAWLAAVWFVLFVVGGLIGEDHDVLWIVDDIIWYALLLSSAALVVMSVTVLVRWFTRSGRESKVSRTS
jgi:hypothetical protein